MIFCKFLSFCLANMLVELVDPGVPDQVLALLHHGDEAVAHLVVDAVAPGHELGGLVGVARDARSCRSGRSP